MRPLRPPITAFALAFLGVIPSAHSAIIGGRDADVQASFPDVVALTYPLPDGQLQLCTGVLVHPEVILTSAHCLTDDENLEITVRMGTDAHSPSATTLSHKNRRHANYLRTKDDFQKTKYDFGIVLLDSEIPGTELAPLASIRDANDLATAMNDGVFVVGYGGKNTINPDSSTGTKRWIQTKIAEHLDSQFTTSTRKSERTGKSGVAGVSRGDSGGPAYILDDHHHRRLIGIASGPLDGTKLQLTGLSDNSFYAALRSEIACWIEDAAGRQLPNLPGSIGCRSVERPVIILQSKKFGTP